MKAARNSTRKMFTARPATNRRGAAMVEFALVAPVLFMFIFGIIEFARLNTLRNTIENAAYEGARRGIIPGATTEHVQDEVLRVLRSISVSNYQVSVTPAVIEIGTTEINVDVSVPLSGAGWVFFFTSGKTVMTRNCTLAREPN